MKKLFKKQKLNKDKKKQVDNTKQEEKIIHNNYTEIHDSDYYDEDENEDYLFID